MAEVQVSNEESLIEPIIKPSSSSNGSIIGPSKEPQTENQETQKLPLSKNQLKKLNKLKYREENKEQRKQHLKEKKKEKKRKLQQEGIQAPKKKIPKQIHDPRGTIAFDFSFGSYMNEKDIKHLLKQLEFCYAINRRSSIPFHIYVTSFCEKIEEIAKATFPVHKSWKLNFETQSHLEVFDKSKIVYLTAESPNKLTTLEEDKIYIIGGLVDHNHHKGLCHRIAIENGLETAHLPINENVQLASRNILTVNQVFEILSLFQETNDWKLSLFKAIPPRKIISSGDEDDGENKNNEDNEEIENGNENENENKNITESESEKENENEN